MIDESSLQNGTAYSSYDSVALGLLLIFISTRWFFEGIIGGIYAEVAVLTAGIIILLIGALKRKPCSLMWLLYCLAILASLIFHGTNFTIALKALIVVIIVMYQLFGARNTEVYKPFIRCLTYIGVINASLVIIHGLVGESFNSAYFPILKSGAAELASYYYMRGNYFGLNYYPTDTAFLIACALAAHILSRKKDAVSGLMYYVIEAMLFVALLLTGKKGILLCSLMAILITALIQQRSRHETIRAILILVLFLGMAYFVRTQALMHPDSPMFFRLNRFLMRIAEGGELDSERRRLVEEALSLWRSSPIWGIGWRKFSGYTVSIFGHSRTHEVNSDYVQFLCETGVVGFVLMMAPIITMLKRTLVSLIDLSINAHKYTDSEEYSLLFAAFIQFLVLAYAIVEIPFYDMPIFAIYMISCCLVNAVYYNKKQIDSSRIFGHR